MASTLIVEDGTGLATADSYLSLADADAYHSKFGNAAWTGSDSAKDAALRKATVYLDRRYGRRWIGVRILDTMALDWPRMGANDADGYAIDEDSVPAGIRNACAELALLALSEELMPDIATPGNITQQTVRVGDIEKSTSWSDGKGAAKSYRKAEMLVAEFVHPSGEVLRA